MYYRQPRYYGDFQCIGSECAENCCYGWRIDWDKDEVDKIKNAPECPEKFREMCDSVFKYNEKMNNYMVVFGENGKCPFLTEDSLCGIQREMGAEYLSYTCAVYPRHYIITDPAIYRYCNMSCREVMKKILNDEKCMDLVNAQIKKEAPIKGGLFNSPERVKKHPEYKYIIEIKEFFYEIIANKKLPLNTCIILGALAAQSLTKIVDRGEYDKIPEAIKTLRSQMHNPEQLKSIANIKTNYNIKLGVTDKLIREFFTSSLTDSFIDKGGRPNIDIYTLSELLLVEEFQKNPFAWRNMALNLILELNTPFKLEDSTIFENYSVFVLAYAFMRHNALTVVETNARLGNHLSINVQNTKVSLNVQNTIVSFSAAISRMLCHNDENQKNLLQRLKDFNMTSPAYLALLVK